MKPEPTYKKLKRLLEQLKTFDEQVDQHIKDQLKQNADTKTDSSDQPTQDDSEPTGEGDQPDST
jgi:hypothetical protein